MKFVHGACGEGKRQNRKKTQQRKRRANANLNFNSVELFSIVHAHNAADHLGDDDHVSEVGLDDLGLLVGDGGLFL